VLRFHHEDTEVDFGFRFWSLRALDIKISAA
jgi:hypothetical protein